MRKKFIVAQKVFSILASFNLLLQSFFVFLPASTIFAQEVTPVEVEQVLEVQPEITPEITPEVTPEVTVEPTSTPEITVTPEPTAVPTEIPTPIPTPTPTQVLVVEKQCLTGQAIIDSVTEDWNIDLTNSVSETKEKVKLGVKYSFPLENKVSITFKCLPKDEGLRTSLKIQQVKVSDLKLPEGTNPAGEYAYDITTGMQDGDFEYDVTLPKPADTTAEISYIEKSVEDAKTNPINVSEVQAISEESISQEPETVKATGVDHFTILLATATVKLSGTVNGLSQVTVAPGAVITVTLNVTTSGSNNNDWQSSRYEIGSEGTNCIDTADHFGNGSYTESFDITAPSTNGTYDLSLRAYTQQSCPQGGTRSSLTLSHAIIVSTPTVTPVPNPTLSQACGLDIALVIDNSTSIDSNELAQIKSAMTAFTGALNGTPTWFSVTKFATTASVVQPFTADISAVNGAINAIPVSGGYTNWQDGLTKAQGTFDQRLDKPNLIIFASDGNPNRTGSAGTTVSESQAVADAVLVANSIKSNTRILAIGVGADLNTANMVAISGSEIDTGNVLTSDVITSDFANLAADLAEFADQTCGRTVTVTKLIDADGNLQTTNDRTPGQGWTFNVGGQTGKITDSNGQTPAVTLATGTGYNVTETLQGGYSLLSASCTGAANNGTQDLPGTRVAGIEITSGNIVACTFINTQNKTDLSLTKSDSPDPVINGGTLTYTLTINNLTAVPAANVVVTDTLPAGFSVTNVNPSVGTCSDMTAPSIQCELGTLAGSASATVTITGTVSTADSTISNTASVSTSTPETSTTNNSDSEDTAVTHSGILRIVKSALGGDDTFTYHIGLCDFSIPGFPSCIPIPGQELPIEYITTSGGAGSLDIPVNEGRYSIGEFMNFDEWTSTSTTCGLEGAYVTAGQTTTCTFTNTKKGHLLVTKVVDPGGDLTNFTINVSGTGSITGDATRGILGGETEDFEVTPGTYSVTENSILGWYPSYSCQDIIVGPGETETCTINNTKYGSITVVKNAIPDSEQDFSFSVTNIPAMGGFVLDDNGDNTADPKNSIVLGSLLPGSYSIIEGVTAGWDPSLVICDSTDGQDTLGVGSAVISLSAGENVTCTFTNTLRRTDVTVTKSDSPDPVNNGGTLTYILTASNLSNDVAAENVVVTDTLPGGFTPSSVTSSQGNCSDQTLPNPVQCELGTLAPLASATVTIVGTVTVPVGVPAFYNDVTVTTDTPETNTENNSDTEETIINHTGTLRIIKNTLGGDETFGFTVVGTECDPMIPLMCDPIPYQAATPSITTSGGTAQVDVPLTEGQFNLQETTIPAGWSADGGVCDQGETPASLDIAPGETVTCTFTNTKKPTLKLVKTVDYGPAQPSDWTLTATGTNGFSDNGNSTTFHTVNVNTLYTLSESSISGWSQYGNWQCDGGSLTGNEITLSAGENIICTITNHRDMGSIRVNKYTDLNGDGDWSDTDETSNSNANSLGFQWLIDGVPYDFGTTADNQATNLFNYYHTITENIPSDYHFVSWYVNGEVEKSCTNPNGTTFPIIPAITKNNTTEITLCNARDTGTITLDKITDPSGDSTLFDLKINNSDQNGGYTPYGTYQAADATAPVVVTVPTGYYGVDETAPVGWVRGSTDCTKTGGGGQMYYNFYVGSGENVTCAFTNAKLAKLTVIKTVTNDNGGTKQVADFPLFVNGESVTSNATNTYSQGNYEVTETGNPSYAATFSGDCDRNGNVTLAYGDNKTCTITNDDIQPKLTVTKIVGRGGLAVVSDFTLKVNETTVTSGTPTGFNVGTYTISETPNANGAGYTGAVTCEGQITNSVTLALGDDKSCTITNTRDTGTVVVHKDVRGQNGEDIVDISKYFGVKLNSGSENFLTDGEIMTYNFIPTGPYTVYESVIPPNYSVYGISLTENTAGNTGGLDITVSKDQTTHVYVTNRQIRGRIIVEKQTLPNGNQQEFSFSGAVSGTIKDGEQLTTEVIPGSYTVSENNPSTSGYRLTGIVCDDANSTGVVQTGTATFNVEPGETVKCTFTNEIFGSITAHKYEDINVNGAQDAGEPDLSGWKMSIYSGSDCQGQLLRQENTDSSGEASFYSIIPGQPYSVGETLEPGWTNVSALCQNVSVTPGEAKQVSFGNFEFGDMDVWKYEDTDGVLGRTEGQEFWIGDPTFTFRVYKDTGSGWVLKGQEDTDNTGKASFVDVFDSTGDYFVCEVKKAGWEDMRSLNNQVNNLSGAIDEYSVCDGITVSTSGYMRMAEFGNINKGEVTVYKFEDLNGNGTYDSGESYLSDWDMVMDQIGGSGYTQKTDETGKTIFSLYPGDYILGENMQAGWTQTNLYCESSPTKGELITASGEAYGHHGNCGGWNGCGDAATCAQWACEVNGYDQAVSYGAEKPCTEFNNCNLFYDRGNVQMNWGNSCPVMGVTDITCGNNTGPTPTSTPTPTPGDLNVSLIGSVYAQEIQPNVRVTPGQKTNCYIGNFKLGKIQGYKYSDENDNGVWDQEEKGIEDWEICLNETNCTRTNADGYYEFTGLQLGEYEISEEHRTGWFQTEPKDPQTYMVQISSGTGLIEGRNYNFGNASPVSLILSKTNDKPVAHAGETITYTLTTAVGSHPLTAMTLIDNLPEGFIYQTGSSTVAGGTVSSVEPTLTNSGKTLTWTWTAVPGSSTVTVTYQAKIDSGNQAASYTNYAYVYGSGSPEGDSEIVDSVVRIDPDISHSTTVGGSVLGAATELPASGSETWYLILALSLIGTGFVIKKFNRKFN